MKLVAGGIGRFGASEHAGGTVLELFSWERFIFVFSAHRTVSHVYEKMFFFFFFFCCCLP